MSFKLLDFSAICIHLLAGARPVFVKMVDDQRGVPVYHEAFDAELNGYTESVETSFVFGGVVGSQKMYSENVSVFILGRCNGQNASTSMGSWNISESVDVEGAIEVYHPVLGASSRDEFLDLGPLSDEVSERL